MLREIREKGSTSGRWTGLLVAAAVALLALMLVGPVWARDFWVDGVNGLDSNDGTSQSTAWKTIGNGDRSTDGLLPGDTVNVLPAVYYRPEGAENTVDIRTVSGTSSAPITFKAYGSGVVVTETPEPARTACGLVARTDYIVFDGFEVRDCWIGVHCYTGNGGVGQNLYVRDCDYGCYSYAASNVTYRNNLVVGNGDLAGVACDNLVSGQSYLYNNTVVGVTYALAMNGTGSATVQNNIAVGSTYGLLMWDALREHTNNLFYNCTTVYDGTSAGPDEFVADPLFVDAAGGNYHLLPGSPAIDKGLNVGIPYYGAAPDLGAFETPEPGTFVALALGLAGFGGLRLRRK